MRTHKLSEGPLVMSVTFCDRVEGKFGSQIQLGGINCFGGEEVTVYISESTALRQLERIGLTEETVIDQAIHIEQVQKDSRTYTNIRAATEDEVNGTSRATRRSGGASAPPPYPRPTSASERAPAASGDAYVLYADCVAAALMVAGSIKEAGYPVTGDNVVAIAATLFIQQSRR